MMRLGLYGGSFDPIHLGHLRPVMQAVEQLQLDRVTYLPTGNPPHKPDVDFAPASRRFAMTEIALLGYERLQVSDLELSDEPSYTIDSVEHFRRLAPGADLHLLLGSDSLARIDTWRRWRDLFDQASLVVLARPGWSREAVLGHVPDEVREAIHDGSVSWVDNRPLDISATEIRRRLRAGWQLPRDWVPEPVLDYVRKYSLYS